MRAHATIAARATLLTDAPRRVGAACVMDLRRLAEQQ
jgi:hypothetical protein